MNPIRPFVLTASLLCASLAPHAAHAATMSTATGHPAVAAGSAAPGRGGAPLASGLLALGSANDVRQAPAAGAQSEESSLAQREQAAPQLREFRGGRVYLYLGGGATLILVLILLLILL